MNPDESQVATPYVKFLRTEASDELLKHPNCFALLALVAQRARREVPVFNPYGLAIGEAMIGDPEAVGLTRQQFRTALANLQKWGLLTTRSTNKGTIAKLSNSAIYDINAEVANQQPNPLSTSIQPAANQTVTTNKNVKNERKEKGASAPLPKPAAKGKDYASLDAADYLLPAWATEKFAADFVEWLAYRQGHRSGKLLKPSVDKILEELANYSEPFCYQLFQHAIKNGNQGLTFGDTAGKYESFKAKPKNAPLPAHGKVGIAGRPASAMTTAGFDALFAPSAPAPEVKEPLLAYGQSTLKVG